MRNYRLYFIGQTISLCGTWIQTIAMGWLVLRLTDSGTILGCVTALQFSPILLFSLWGGVLADRYSKRKLLFITQSAYCLLAAFLGILILSGVINIWMVYIIAFSWGLVNVVDNPARHSFMAEIVDDEKGLANAIPLNAFQVNITRAIGPAIGGILIAKLGLAACFLANAVSFIAMLVVLVKLRPCKSAPLGNKTTDMLKETIPYIKSSVALSRTLIMIFIIGALVYEFPVSLPLFAKFSFGGDAKLYAKMMSALGIGSALGGLLTAYQQQTLPSKLAPAAFFVGISMLITSLAPSENLALISLSIAGVTITQFLSLGNTILQLQSSAKMRGRIMALWSMSVLGSTFIGGPIIGWISEHFDPRWGLATGGIAAIVAAGIGWYLKEKEPDSTK
jgi:MFS family permease